MRFIKTPMVSTVSRLGYWLNNDAVHFCIVFFGGILIFAAVYLKIKNSPVFDSFINLNAGLVNSILNLFGAGSVVHGAVVSSNSFSFEVTLGCTSIVPTAILAILVLAWPGRIREKLACIAAVSGGLFALNLVRLGSLYYIGASFPGFFQIAHIYIWQPLLYILPTFLWFVWFPARREPSQT